MIKLDIFDIDKEQTVVVVGQFYGTRLNAKQVKLFDIFGSL